MFLLDTCVLSEGVRPRPASSVVRWMTFQDAAGLFISAVTLGELYFGTARLPVGAKRRELESWVGDVERRFANRVIVLDDAVARHWGHLRALNPTTPTVDAQIAATALAYGMTFVTRNVRHFQFSGLNLVNPWDDR